MASEQMLQVAEMFRGLRLQQPTKPTLEESRAQMEALLAASPIPDDVVVDDLVMAGVPCRWTMVPVSRASKIIFYLHGGGYVMGSVDTHQELMAREPLINYRKLSVTCGVSGKASFAGNG